MGATGCQGAEPSSATKSVWAVGDELLVRYDYVDGRLVRGDGLGEAWPLPRQTGDHKAYGHELTPVHGNPDRLWVGANAGIVQFSKSGAADCYADSQGTWPLPRYVTGDAAKHWCTDYANRVEITGRTLIKSVGNDPATGTVISTCAGGCPETQTTGNSWDTAYIRFVPTTGPQSVKSVSTADRRYKATWAVPAHQ
ncbi:hypothetical protein [Streptomyces sp. SP18BB07]|uniref:hypothetical protein n=1 Tax=Streptomyces sp. SP18BB07 TaxID=3002522 RepID=UPI002E774155|nr:hypothetical protein [Streptomyces sp. SP18BB07]MEE1763904.1 hypothetical protein [Streptomyces sp. SP18BB07]